MFGKFIDWVVSKLGFFPPRPTTYNFLETEDGSLGFDDLWLPMESGVKMTLSWLHNAVGERLPTIHFKHRQSGGVTLLFSHGNAVDMGMLREHFLALVCMLKVDLFAYDYSGFGPASGSPTEANLYYDINAAYSFLTMKLSVPPSKVVLYGQSIGTAPTVDLASRTSNLRGVILHSPFTSGVRVFFPNCGCYPVDVFQNIDKASAIGCPVLIMHGTGDRVIHISHAMQLHRELEETSVMPLFIQGAGHNNLECYTDYSLRLCEFLHHLQVLQGETLAKSISSNNNQQETSLEHAEKASDRTRSLSYPSLWLSGLNIIPKIRLIRSQEAPPMIASPSASVASTRRSSVHEVVTMM